ncbi:MAG: 2-(1,2-epoxy,2-dihydrophenyl)acetyl-CoA isomerase [Chloroflexi bacterium]|nr:2-(1,2-epoxy,2-dihydrophenyl)acetyl-CoA isomerase [Chloroflexota bacterium]
MPYQFINFERSEGVGTVTLNRPEQLNAFTPAMLLELSDVFRGMERDPLVRAIIITGAGRAFCGGENFRQRAETELGGTPPAFESFSSNFTNPTSEGNGSAPYIPSSLSASNPPPPQFVTEFSPLNPAPVSVENNRLAGEGSIQPVEVTNPRSQPVFNAQEQAGQPGPAAASNNGPSLADQVRRGYNPLIRQIRGIEKPVIAAVNGIAAGTGLGLALACDIRYASDRARFVEVSVRIGLLPGSGTGYFLPRLIGLSKALELAFNGDELDAEGAEKYGLVSRVTAGDALMDETRKLAVRLAKGPTRAIGLTKTMMYRSANMNLEQALDLEAHLAEEATRSQDYKEGLRAFNEKRPPEYKGF